MPIPFNANANPEPKARRHTYLGWYTQKNELIISSISSPFGAGVKFS